MLLRDKFKQSKQKEIIKKYYRQKFCEEQQNKKYISILSNLAKKDIKFKFFNNLAHRATKELKKRNLKRKWSHRELLGCNPDVLENYIKKKLKDNMTFDNYGLWEIDHIKPISSFNLLNDKQVLECFNFKNLQPLWKDINLKKSNNINFNCKKVKSIYLNKNKKTKFEKLLDKIDFID